MKWSEEAEKAIKKVPFFVKKKVRKKIEQYVADNGRDDVTLEDTQAAGKQFLANMSKDIKGYQADRCFGASGCPHTANGCGSLLTKAEALLEQEDILSFLKQHVKGELKYHHEFRLSTADCPNACSQPQVKDVGILGAVQPELSEEPCSMCGACVHACPDECISLGNEDIPEPVPVIDFATCLMCGKCIEACPTGTIRERAKGFRLLLGGCLGRHPRLALEYPGILSEEEVLSLLKRVLKFYKEKSTDGARFAKIFHSEEMKHL